MDHDDLVLSRLGPALPTPKVAPKQARDPATSRRRPRGGRRVEEEEEQAEDNDFHQLDRMA